MLKLFCDFFAHEKITQYAEIDAKNLRIINEGKMPQNIKSAIVFLIPYYTGAHPDRNLSLYAVSKDYHLYAKGLGNHLCELAKEYYPQEEFYSFCDNSPISDISAALHAGLGVLGKNRLLINDVYGSYVFIGILLSTMKSDTPVDIPFKTCLECGACEKVCEFLKNQSGVCLSELNQRKVLTEDELATVLSHKIRWGCDRCQEVCPMNNEACKTPIEFFYEDNIEHLTHDMIEKMSKQEFGKRAYAWRGKKTILRNVGDL